MQHISGECLLSGLSLYSQHVISSRKYTNFGPIQFKEDFVQEQIPHNCRERESSLSTFNSQLLISSKMEASVWWYNEINVDHNALISSSTLKWLISHILNWSIVRKHRKYCQVKMLNETKVMDSHISKVLKHWLRLLLWTNRLVWFLDYNSNIVTFAGYPKCS